MLRKMINIKLYGNINIKGLQLLGRGTQGEVYRIDSEKCIKIFKSKQDCKDELNTLTMARLNNHFPKLYEAGDIYIIRECVNGIELNKYLLKNKLAPPISSKIIELYEAMKEVGFTRLDAAIFHIFITPSDNLKLIDTAKAMKKTASIPDLIISGLEDLGCKESFFNYLKNTRKDLYTEWIKYTKINYKKKGV